MVRKRIHWRQMMEEINASPVADTKAEVGTSDDNRENHFGEPSLPGPASEESTDSEAEGSDGSTEGAVMGAVDEAIEDACGDCAVPAAEKASAARMTALEHDRWLLLEELAEQSSTHSQLCRELRGKTLHWRQQYDTVSLLSFKREAELLHLAQLQLRFKRHCARSGEQLQLMTTSERKTLQHSWILVLQHSALRWADKARRDGFYWWSSRINAENNAAQTDLKPQKLYKLLMRVRAHATARLVQNLYRKVLCTHCCVRTAAYSLLRTHCCVLTGY